MPYAGGGCCPVPNANDAPGGAAEKIFADAEVTDGPIMFAAPVVGC